ncbi:MAG: glycosyltransferase [Clostridia bacterium]|nr:glycosyltransferase [Clostridia bacterium]
MKFSILVPVYNVEKYLEQCVDSLLSQDYDGEYEIILVDDGSTDSSGKICDKYAEENPEIVKVYHKKNEGLVSAREAGIKNAAGDVCLFVDSDDFADNCLLAKISNVYTQNPDADIVIYSFSYFTDGTVIPRKRIISEALGTYEGERKKELYSSLLFSTSTIPIWTKAVKTELLKKDATDYSLYYEKNMAEDWFRSINLITLAKKVVNTNISLYNYRTNNQSISRSFSAENIDKKNILYVYERLTELLPKWGMDNGENRQKLKARWLNETMYTFSKYMENAKCLKDIKLILNYNWSSMLPEGVENNPNEYENKTYRKLFEKLKSKEYFSILLFFIKKKTVRKIRDLKSKVLGK